MTNFTVGEMASAMGADFTGYVPAIIDRVVSGVSTDTHTIAKGDVYFAIRGERFDGAEYVRDAFKAGAHCAVVNRGGTVDEQLGPVLVVDDTVLALGAAAKAYRALFQGTVVGITGSNGKTTTKDMIKAILSVRYSVQATEGNYNNHIGLPLSIFRITPSDDYAVLELGMSAQGEIARLADIAAPHIGVLLNVGLSHSEFFETVEDIADAKAELFDGILAGGRALVNADDPLFREREKRFNGEVVHFGIDNEADYRAGDIIVSPDGCASFSVEGRRVTLQIPGRHNVYNALAAYAVGRMADVKGEDCVEALSDVEPSSMRMQKIVRDGITYLNDSYNANPLSMKAAAMVLADMNNSTPRRRIAVIGDMRELGSYTEDAHREIGSLFGSLGLDELVCVGDNARLYADSAVGAGMDAGHIYTVDSTDAAITVVNSILVDGDLVLVKGSRALKLDRIAG